MKVRSHLLLLVLAVVGPLVLFSVAVLNYMIDAERQAVLRGMQELARGTLLIMDKEMSVSMATARSLSGSLSLLEGNFEEFYRQAKHANSGRDANLALIDESGQQLLNTAIEFGAPVPPPTDITRKRVAAMFANNKPGYSNLLKGRATKKYIVAAEFPVQIKDNRRFLVNVWMYAGRLNELIPKRDVPRSWLISVFDRDGVTIGRNIDGDKFIGELPLEKQHKAVLSKHEGTSRGTVRGGMEVYGYWYRSPTTGWTVAVGVPVAEVHRAAVRSVSLTILGFVVAIGVAALCAVLVSRRLVHAIQKVSESATLLGTSKVPPIENLQVTEMNELQLSLHQAGLMLAESEAGRVRHLEDCEKARAAAEQAQSVAEEQNKSKDEFLAMLGHELRNPLAAIASGVTVLNLPNVSDDLSAKTKTIISRQTKHLTHLVDELLDAHRILSGKITLMKSPVDLQVAVRNCLAAFEARGATLRHQLSINVSTALIEADPTRLEQIIGNLVDNAVKYTPEGGSISIQVRTEGDVAIFSVEDTGIGMAPELLQKAFDVFVQGKVINRVKGGLGVGLAVVNSLARQHGATLTAKSPGPGLGSTFTVRFPRLGQVELNSDLAQSDVSPLKAKVLVIEDNLDVREMTCVMLSEFGFHVFSAENGRAGIDSTRINMPEVALVDIDLPDMSGYEVATQIRADDRLADMQLIAVTGYGQSSDKEKALACGFDVHLKKPVNVSDLITAINEFNRRRIERATSLEV
jgi:signal transduction histidine kinase/ActR/RegA family two-component response regulator